MITLLNKNDAMGRVIRSIPVVVACFDYAFMVGTMGSVVGDEFRATRRSQRPGAENSFRLHRCFGRSADAGERVFAHADGKMTVVLTKLTEAG
jgi:acetyl-CoA carboxylase carboxyl transferase subunit beta